MLAGAKLVLDYLFSFVMGNRYVWIGLLAAVLWGGFQLYVASSNTEAVSDALEKREVETGRVIVEAEKQRRETRKVVREKVQNAETKQLRCLASTPSAKCLQ